MKTITIRDDDKLELTPTEINASEILIVGGIYLNCSRVSSENSHYSFRVTFKNPQQKILCLYQNFEKAEAGRQIIVEAMREAK